MGIFIKLRHRKVDRLKLTTLHKLTTFNKNLPKQEVEKSLNEFSKIVNYFFSKHFNTNYTFDYYDLKETINDKKGTAHFKKSLLLFTKDISDLKYGKKKILKKHISELSKRFTKIIEILSKKKRSYVTKEALLDFLIGKYLDCYDSFVKKLKNSFSRVNTKKKKS